MNKFSSLLQENKTWLIERILSYSKKHGYYKFMTGLSQPWNSAIEGINSLLISSWDDDYPEDMEFGLRDDLLNCPISKFITAQARKHRLRGINLGMFVGILKYFRRSYLDLIISAHFDPKYERLYIFFIARFFDRMEISLSSTWPEDNSQYLEELQQTNRELTSEKIKYITIFESLPTPAMLLDELNEIESVNHSFTQTFPSPKKVCQWLAKELSTFANTQVLHQDFEKAFISKETTKYFEIKMKRMLDLRAKQAGTVIIFNDITARIQSEQILKENGELFRSYFENAAVGTALVAIDGQYLKVNDSLCTMFGYSKEELLTLSFKSITHPDDINKSLSFVGKLLSGDKKSCHLEKRYFHKSGYTVWAQLSISLVMNFENKPDYFVVQVKDNTQQKWAEFALKESLKKYITLFNNANDVIALRELRADGMPGRIIEINDAACKKLGYSREELLNMHATDFMTEESLAMLRTRTHEYLNGGTITCELTYITKNGNKIPFEFSSHVFYQNGKKVILAIARDISERKKLEKEYSKISKVDSLSLLAGGVAHDFKNFLTIILGNVSLAKLKLKEGNEILNRLLEAEKAAQEANKLTKQLLTFAKGGELDKKVIDIRSIIKDTTSFSLSTSVCNYQVNIPEDLWQIEADQSQLIQVLSNLILNADQAMPNGGSIKLTAENHIIDSENLILAKGPYVKIVIEDEGLGIEVDNLSKIFEPYFTTKRDGHGLGLATCYSIIKTHGGHIEVHSKVGVGTIFTIYLPSPVSKSEMGQTVQLKNTEDKNSLLVLIKST